MGGEAPVARDLASEIVKLLARDQANIFQRPEVLISFCGFAYRQVELTEVFMRPAMPAIQGQRLPIILHRRPRLAQSVIGVTDIVLNVGVAGVA